MHISLHNMQQIVKRDVASCEFATRSDCRHIHVMQLTSLRKARDLSLRDLGEMIGMNASTVQRAEAMHESAKLRTYQLCADVLGVSLADLFSDDRTATELALLNVFRRIPVERHGELIHLLEIAASPAPSKDQ